MIGILGDAKWLPQPIKAALSPVAVGEQGHGSCTVTRKGERNPPRKIINEAERERLFDEGVW